MCIEADREKSLNFRHLRRGGYGTHGRVAFFYPLTEIGDEETTTPLSYFPFQWQLRKPKYRPRKDRPVFSNGMLQIAFSRPTTIRDQGKILASSNNVFTPNVV